MRLLYTAIFLGVCTMAGADINADTTHAGSANLYLVGDSTLSIKADNKRPETGWGEKLPAFFRPQVQIHNHAVNGRSTRSFLTEGRWQQVLDQLQAGDYVIIQFGHNDQKSADPSRFTNPYSSYRHNLQRYVTETRARNATPILMSSIVRRNFNEHGTLLDTHSPYPAVMRQLARELNVAFVDMNTLSEMLVAKLGVEASKDIYLHVAEGENKNYPDGVSDDTHLNPAGAQAIAEIAAQQLCQLNTGLEHWLTDCN